MIKLFEQYRAGERVYSRIVDPVCNKFNINHMEFTIIMFLYNNKEFDTARDIVKYKKMTKSHVSLGIKNLSNRGLLKTWYRDDDHKTIHLSLTDEAIVIAKDGRVAQERFQDISLEGFTEKEVETLLSYIDRINNNIKNYK